MSTAFRIAVVHALFIACASTCSAATLHGRVKDQQCAVLSRVSVQIRPTHASGAAATRTLLTDSSGDYTLALSPGSYQACFQRGNTAPVCEDIQIPVSGDTWITTQLRDAAPDLSHLGNHAY